MSQPKLLYLALMALFSESTTTAPTYSPTCSPIRLAQNHLHHSLSDSAIALFHTLSPRATAAALSELDTQACLATPGDFTSRSAPYLLARLVRLVTCEGHIAAHVGDASHVVILSSLHYSQTDTVYVRSEDADTASAACSCSAFVFRPKDEQLCKHIIVTAIAAIAGLTPTEKISPDHFVNFIKPDTN